MPSMTTTLLTLTLFAPGWALAQPSANPSFVLDNQGAVAVKELYATPAGQTNWGRDRLDGKGLAKAAKVSVHLVADGNCVFDLKVVFADGRSEERRRQNTCQSKLIAVGETKPPAAAAKTWRLINRGTVPIVEIAARPPGTEKWLPDRLPAGPIAPGSERAIALPPGGQCLFDLKVTFKDGKAREKRAADLCKSPEQAVQ
jgi:hypothetical protein